ncbi:MAG: PqqD family protein, partial [Pyrinomonadaceae bacterium]
RGLEERLSLEEIVGRITTAYEVDDEHATRSVRRVLENFRNLKLVREG